MTQTCCSQRGCRQRVNSPLEDAEADASKSTGLLNFLMRDRHGRYDDETEVLTSHGWIPWLQVTGSERFATLSPDGRIKYQYAQRLVRRNHDGPMVRVKTCHVDLLVTPEHRMRAKRRRQSNRERWDLVPASDLFGLRTDSHLVAATGVPSFHWTSSSSLAPARFFIGDGHSRGGTARCPLRKEREITALHQWAGELGYDGGAHRRSLLPGCGRGLSAVREEVLRRQSREDRPEEVLECDPEALRPLSRG